MSKQFAGTFACQHRKRYRTGGWRKGNNRCRMMSYLGVEEVICTGNRILAAVVGLRRWRAFPLQATLDCLAGTRPAEAVQGTNQQHDHQHADRDLDCPLHSSASAYHQNGHPRRDSDEARVRTGYKRGEFSCSANDNRIVIPIERKLADEHLVGPRIESR
jgi:hypothetical protein